MLNGPGTTRATANMLIQRQLSTFAVGAEETAETLKQSGFLEENGRGRIQPFLYACDEPADQPAFDRCLASAESRLQRLGQSLEDSTKYHIPVLITTMSAAAKQHHYDPTRINIFCPLLNFVDNSASPATNETIPPHLPPPPHCDDYPPYSFSNQRLTYNVSAPDRPNGLLKRNDQSLWWYISCMSQGCDMDLPDNSHSRGCDRNNTCRSGWPSYMVDTTFVRNRKMGALAYLYDIRGELYWEVDAFDSTGSDGLLHFGGNGDGQLLYPGRAATIGGEEDIPLASVRLKHIRDGLEDLEFLYLMEEALDKDHSLMEQALDEDQRGG